ncbi:MAG: urea transporter [Verrucomicrobiaceae bacterium]|nr:urea transporter [Verrucomicrobiaceae bacterium]
MLSLPPPEHPGNHVTLAMALREGVPRAYSAIFFSNSERLGWWFIAVTMLVPDMGIAGLGGVILAGALAWWLGFDHDQLRAGHLLFNSMLACNTVAWLHHGYAFPTGMFIGLWFAAAFGALLLSVGMGAFFGNILGLGAHSFPAVAVSYVLYFLTWALMGPFQLATAARSDLVDLTMLPPMLRAICQGFGSMLFMPVALPGALTMIGVAIQSRLTLLAALSGFAGGFAGMQMLGLSLEPSSVLWCGFNFLLCGVALSIGYYTPSRASLMLGTVAAFLCAPVAIAVATALRYFELPASALPANLVILAMIYALKQRRQPGALLPNLHASSGPELSARLRCLEGVRFPFIATPAVRLPFEGERIITQGFNGPLTHRGAWRHALDFEARENGLAWSGSGESLEDFATFDTPVIAPCDGTIARSTDRVQDNEPGRNNPETNWGNFVLIQSDAGPLVMLAHLRHESILVTIGQRVQRGDLLGKCGNSGRSPIPHLHLHVQTSLVTGAATRPFCLGQYLTQRSGDAGWIYHTAGLPAEGQIISTASPDRDLQALHAGWLPGEYRWRITREGQPTKEEAIVMDFDDTGCYRVSSRRHRAGFRAFLRDGEFFCTDFDGPGESITCLLALILGRVPCIQQPPEGVTWSDHFSTVPFASSPMRWLHDTLDPFIGPSLAEYQFTFAKTNKLRCSLYRDSQDTVRMPHTVEAELAERCLVKSIKARFDNGQLLCAEMVQYSVG